MTDTTNNTNTIDSEIAASLLSFSHALASLSRQAALLGTQKDTLSLRESLSSAQESLSAHTKSISASLKKPPGPAQQQQQQQRKLARAKLSKDFDQLQGQAQALYKVIAQKTRDSIPVDSRPVPSSFTRTTKKPYVQRDLFDEANEQEPLLSSNHSNQYTQQQQQQEQIQIQEDPTLNHDIAFNDALIDEREADLLLVEKSVAQVNEIFRDLGTLVHEQQYMLDNIESNVAAVEVNVENATGELRSANEYQKRARKKWVCLLSVALVVLLVLVLLAKPWTWF
jgi:syntaxin 7